MAALDAYSQSYERLIEFTELTKMLLDYCRTLFGNFEMGLAKFEKELAELNPTLPNKRSKKSVFAKQIGPDMIENMEPYFTGNWENVIIKTFVPFPGLQLLRFNLTSFINTGFEELYAKFNQISKHLVERVDLANDEFMEAVRIKDKGEYAYQSFCKQIEDAFRRFITPTQADLEADVGHIKDLQMHLRGKLDSLKAEYPSHREKAADNVTEFNVARFKFGLAIEEFMTGFEQCDKTVYEGLVDQHQKIVDMLDQYSAAKEAVEMGFCNFMDEGYNCHQDFDEFLARENILIPPDFACKQVVSVVEPIPFNLCDIIGPEKVFGKELKYHDAEVVKSHKARNSKEVDVFVDQPFVTVHKVKFGMAKIMNHYTHKMGKVPKEVLRICPIEKGLFRMNCDFDIPETGVKLLKDEIVMATVLTESAARVQTQTRYAGTVPTKYLDPMGPIC